MSVWSLSYHKSNQQITYIITHYISSCRIKTLWRINSTDMTPDLFYHVLKPACVMTLTSNLYTHNITNSMETLIFHMGGLRSVMVVMCCEILRWKIPCHPSNGQRIFVFGIKFNNHFTCDKKVLKIDFLESDSWNLAAFVKRCNEI